MQAHLFLHILRSFPQPICAQTLFPRPTSFLQNSLAVLNNYYFYNSITQSYSEMLSDFFHLALFLLLFSILSVLRQIFNIEESIKRQVQDYMAFYDWLIIVYFCCLCFECFNNHNILYLQP